MCGCSRHLCIVFVATIAVVLGLWRRALNTGPVCISKTDLTGKSVLITGGNVGIGKETAIGLARHDARVIIACRNEEKARKAVQDIKRESSKDAVEYVNLDLSDMEGIRQFAKDFSSKEGRLDILINNAATVNVGKTRDGFDMMFGVNHLGPFLLTNLLMPLLKKTSEISPVRIINVSSEGYKAGKIDFNNLNPDMDDSTTMAGCFLQYSTTKLMNLYFTSELDKRLKQEFKGRNQAITTYSLHPGSIESNLGHDLAEARGGLTYIVRNTFRMLLMKPVFFGAQTTLCCSLQQGIEGFSGKYFKDLKPVELWDHATDPEVGRRLWEVSEKFTGISPSDTSL